MIKKKTTAPQLILTLPEAADAISSDSNIVIFIDTVDIMTVLNSFVLGEINAKAL